MVAGQPLPQGDNSVGRLAHALQSLDPDAKRVVGVAHNEAYRYASDFIASAHLLLGLVAVAPAAVTASVLGQRGELPEKIRSQVELLMGARIRQRARIVHLPYTPHARAVVINAAAHAQRVESATTTPEHLWSALTAATGSLAARTLSTLHLLGQEPS